MRHVLILGAGRIGRSMTALLQGTGEYQVTLGDRDPATLAKCTTKGAQTLGIDSTDMNALKAAMAGKHAVVGAGPYAVNVFIAEAAAACGVDYFDVTEDVEVTNQVRKFAKGAKSAFVPQCGLAPGFISIVANDLAKQFETLRELRLRVGALPRFPANRLGYNLTWSTDGLINEYLNPCEVIHDGRRVLVPPMEGEERFAINGVEYEAFTTSGGVGSLCETYDGKVETLTYKTIRYPGHCEAMRLILEDLHLKSRRPLLKEILEGAIPETRQDVIIVFVTATGMQDGRLNQISFARAIHGAELDGHAFSGIEITTAGAAAAMIDLKYQGKLPQSGFVRQEDVSLADFLENRFGKVYA
ncbi:saccharopine dehydrogenase family protein [Lacibacterium aquatile]|uniref:Saccharopine dehydrogenase family protein n=1 Tax=Lacibacterium aquatile TaxID=1168082 RepID=A0ABW5DQ05_9PROT